MAQAGAKSLLFAGVGRGGGWLKGAMEGLEWRRVWEDALTAQISGGR